MRDMTAEEMAALAGIKSGDLTALADLLAAETDTLHFTISRELVRLIRGDKNWTDYRLRAERHPDLKPGEATKAEKLDLFSKDMGHVSELIRQGVLKPGQHDSAVIETARLRKVSRSTVERAWRRRKAFAKFCRAHGVAFDGDH